MRSEKQQKKRNSHLKSHLRVLAVAAFLAALSIVCGKYLAIPIGTVLRFSFENLPILLSGMMFGPAVGVLTGVTADLVGCILVGYAINPIVTVGAASIGLLGAVYYRLTSRLALWARVLLSVTVAHLVGSVLIKTWGLAAFYSMPFSALLLWRLLNYVIVAGAEGLLLYYLLKKKTVRTRLQNLR